MLETFYSRFGEVSLVLLGLWLIVVQTRHKDWTDSAPHRRQATAVTLIFGVPGTLSLLSLIDPTTPELWQVSFIVGGALGALGILTAALGPPPRQSPAIRIGLWSATLVHGGVAVIAAVAAATDELAFEPLEVEAVLLTLLFVVGLAVAWMLTFPPADLRRR